MSHGNVATHIGTCAACGREDVELHFAAYPNRKTGEYQLNCVDMIACFHAWLAKHE